MLIISCCVQVVAYMCTDKTNVSIIAVELNAAIATKRFCQSAWLSGHTVRPALQAALHNSGATHKGIVNGSNQ